LSAITREFPNLNISLNLGADMTVGAPHLVTEMPAIEDQSPDLLYIVYVDPTERDTIFGGFLEKWDALEALLGQSFYCLVGTSFEVAQTLIASYNGTKQICDLIEALAEDKLDESTLKSLSNLMDRVRKFGTKRNKIIHGHWEMTVSYETVHGPNGPVFRQTGANWRRVYSAIRATERLNASSQKGDAISEKNIFTLDRFWREMPILDVLKDDLSDFFGQHLAPMLNAERP